MEQEKVLEIAKSCGLEPRDYQARLISKASTAFAVDKLKSVLIESPTGSGKTVMGLMVLKMLQQADPNLHFGWVAMRKKLLAQAADENKRVGVKNIEFVSMFDSNPPKCDLIVTDEAQHDAASTMGGLHKSMGADLALGLTATPFRTDRIKLSYQKVIKDCGVRFLIEQGYLSEFDLYIIPEWSPDTVAKHLIEGSQDWGKSVTYFKDKPRCSRFNDLMQDSHVSAAMMLGSDHPVKVREPIFQAFDTGEIQVLSNIQLLTEGFDQPDLNSVWVRDSNKLVTMQMAGRVLRKDPNNPNKIAKIIQSGNTVWPYPRCTGVKPRKQFLYDNGRWLSVNASDKLKKAMNSVRNRTFIPTIMPSYFTGERISSISVDAKGWVKTSKTRQSQSKKEDDAPSLFD